MVDIDLRPPQVNLRYTVYLVYLVSIKKIKTTKFAKNIYIVNMCRNCNIRFIDGCGFDLKNIYI